MEEAKNSRDVISAESDPSGIPPAPPTLCMHKQADLLNYWPKYKKSCLLRYSAMQSAERQQATCFLLFSP
jgi:hypothetical protein